MELSHLDLRRSEIISEATLNHVVSELGSRVSRGSCTDEEEEEIIVREEDPPSRVPTAQYMSKVITLGGAYDSSIA